MALPDQAAKSIRLPKSQHILLEPGIILMLVNEGTTFELADAKKAHKAHLELSEGGLFCVLLDTQGGFFIVSSEAKKKIASAEYARYMKASAFVVTSLAARIAGNFFIKFMKPAAPTRLFASRQKALIWLRKFVH